MRSLAGPACVLDQRYDQTGQPSVDIGMRLACGVAGTVTEGPRATHNRQPLHPMNCNVGGVPAPVATLPVTSVPSARPARRRKGPSGQPSGQPSSSDL